MAKEACIVAVKERCSVVCDCHTKISFSMIFQLDFLKYFNLFCSKRHVT